MTTFDIIEGGLAETRQQLLDLLVKEPHLCSRGFGVRADQREAEHQQLLAQVKDIAWLVGWLQENVQPTKKVNQRHTSYGLKHVVEAHFPRKYVSNGVFIAAAILAGFPYKVEGHGPNAYFGMSQRSLRYLCDGDPQGDTASPNIRAGFAKGEF